MGPDSTRREFVYLLGSKPLGWYKIGRSTNPRMRRFAIDSVLPFEIELLAVWETDRAVGLERDMHDRCSANRVRGEWFRFTGEQLTALLNSQDYGNIKFVRLETSASFAGSPEKKRGRQAYWQDSQQQYGKCRQCGKLKESERQHVALCLRCSKKAAVIAKKSHHKKRKEALQREPK